MKAKITADESGHVTLSYDVEEPSEVDSVRRVERIFSCPVDGGYVLEYHKGDWTQVCDRLGRMGDTLRCASRDALLALIRREYQVMRRTEQREADRYR